MKEGARLFKRTLSKWTAIAIYRGTIYRQNSYTSIDHRYDPEIKVEDVNKDSSLIKEGKTTGPNDFYGEFLKLFDLESTTWLTNIFKFITLPKKNPWKENTKYGIHHNQLYEQSIKRNARVEWVRHNSDLNVQSAQKKQFSATKSF